jgi:hypothetical protein
VNVHDYALGYYLADDIFPSWAIFVKTIQNPKTKKQAEFAKAQEACRKDIKRVFGALQDRFAIVRGPAHFWDKKSLIDIMTACVILHNMIIKDERGLSLEFFFDNVGSRVRPERNPNHPATHSQLQNNLIEHH